MTRYCTDPKHSRPATEEERRQDLEKRYEALDENMELLSVRQRELAMEIFQDFDGYRRCTLIDARETYRQRPKIHGKRPRIRRAGRS